MAEIFTPTRMATVPQLWSSKMAVCCRRHCCLYRQRRPKLAPVSLISMVEIDNSSDDLLRAAAAFAAESRTTHSYR